MDEWNVVIGIHGEVVNNTKEQQSKQGEQLKIKHKVGARREDALNSIV